MIRNTGQPVPHKGCNSSSCCSPAKIWRTLQLLIKSDSRKELVQFFKDDRLEHIVRVALTSRISNDVTQLPPSQKHKIIRLSSRESHLCLGKSFTDLNLLQLALLSSSEGTVMALLNQLKAHASAADLKQFVHHVWGQGNTSLHLAVFLKRRLVIKALIDLGCVSGALNARKKTAIDCCLDDRAMLDIFVCRDRIKKVEQAPPVATIIAMEAEPQKEPEVEAAVDETRISAEQQQQASEPVDPTEKSIVILHDQLKQQEQEQQKHFSQQRHINRTLTRSCLLTCMKQQLVGTFNPVPHSMAQIKKPPDIPIACY